MLTMWQILATVAASTIAAVIDAFTGEIPEWITVPLIITGLAYAALAGYFVQAFIVAAITLALGYALYYTGQLGGGDVLLLTGIGAWIPLALPEKWGAIAYIFNVPMIVLFLGLLYSSLFFSVYYTWILSKDRRWMLALLLPYPFLPPALALTYGTIVTAYLGNRYRDALFVRERSVDKLIPEDVLAEDVEGLPPGKHVLEKKDIERLKEMGVKTVKILDNLPRFGPFTLLALLTVIYLMAHPMNLDAYASALFSFKIYPLP